MPFPNKASAPSEAMISNARRYNARQAGNLWNVGPGVDPGSREFALTVFAYQGLRNADCPPPRPGSALANECDSPANQRVCCGNIDGMLGPQTLAQMMVDARAPGADITQLQLASLAEWGLTGGVPSILTVAYSDAGSRGAIPRAYKLLPAGQTRSQPQAPTDPGTPPQQPKSSAAFWFKTAVVLFVVYKVVEGQNR